MEPYGFIARTDAFPVPIGTVTGVVAPVWVVQGPVTLSAVWSTQPAGSAAGSEVTVTLLPARTAMSFTEVAATSNKDFYI